MRTAQVILIGALGLALTACPGGGTNKGAAVAKPRELIVGKWEATDPAQIVQVYEFADDGTLKVSLKDQKEAAPGKFKFTNDETMEVDYQVPEEVKKAYRDQVKEV